VIGGIRQMTTKRELSKPKKAKVEQCLNYFAQRCEYMKYDEYYPGVAPNPFDPRFSEVSVISALFGIPLFHPSFFRPRV
jgi:hypothetical protein